jgi:hypothetical protein
VAGDIGLQQDSVPVAATAEAPAPPVAEGRVGAAEGAVEALVNGFAAAEGQAAAAGGLVNARRQVDMSEELGEA